MLMVRILGGDAAVFGACAVPLTSIRTQSPCTHSQAKALAASNAKKKLGARRHSAASHSYHARTMLSPRTHPQAKALAAAKAKEELDALRTLLLQAVLTGQSFLEEGKDSKGPATAYEGMSPKEINELAAKFRGSAMVSDDPFEGMSPEEIDEYARIHGLT